MDFIYQHTLTNKYKNFIKVTSQRSGQPGVNAKEFQKFEISIPKRDEQQKVGRLLKTTDQLITVNQRPPPPHFSSTVIYLYAVIFTFILTKSA